MIGAVLRGVRGLEVNDETLAADVIETVVTGEGHYLGHQQTLARMKSDYYYPEVADRQSPNDWKDAGSLDIRERARNRAREVLQSHFPSHLSPELDARIRADFDILLPASAMHAHRSAMVHRRCCPGCRQDSSLSSPGRA